MAGYLFTKALPWVPARSPFLAQAIQPYFWVEEHSYAEPFSADPRRVHRVGCAFDSRTRLLTDWLVA